MKKIFSLTTLLCLLIACKQPIGEVIIDNPSDKEYKLEFKKQPAINVPPNSKFPAQVKFGKNTISINDQEPITIQLDKDKEYIINPSLAQYYIEDVVYTVSSRGQKRYEEDYGVMKTKIGAFELNGNFQKIEPTLLIEKHWLFDLDSDPSEIVGIKVNPKRGYKICKKIVRHDDIMKEVSDYIIQEFDLVKDEK